SLLYGWESPIPALTCRHDGRPIVQPRIPMPADNDMPEYIARKLRSARSDYDKYGETSGSDDDAMVWLADALDKARADNAAFRQREMDHENAEASVCPEDVGFVEYIGSLKSALDRAQRERDEWKSTVEAFDALGYRVRTPAHLRARRR